jgi:hypothetical protein
MAVVTRIARTLSDLWLKELQQRAVLEMASWEKREGERETPSPYHGEEGRSPLVWYHGRLEIEEPCLLLP